MKYKKKYKQAPKQKEIPKKNSIKNLFDIYVAPYSTWVLLGIIIIIGFIGFGKYITAEYLFFFKDIGSDSLNQNYPFAVHKLKILNEQLFGTWSFYKGMGNQYTETIPTDPRVLFYKILFYIGTSIFGVKYLIYGRFINIFIFHFLLSGILFYFYQRTISIKKYTALIGAIILTFSGYMVVGSAWGITNHIFMATFLLFSFEQLYVKKRWYFFPFAILYLSNNIFILFIYVLFLLIYFLFRYFSTKHDSIKSFFLIAGKMFVLGIVGILMNLRNSIGLFQKMFFSPRVAGNASYSQTLSGGEEIIEHSNLTATTLLRFFSNDILGTGSNFQGWSNYFESPLFYIGIITLLLFPQIFIHLNLRKKIVFGTFLGFWALTLIFPYLRHAFLAFTGDYFRFGFDFFIPFTLLLFSVLALNNIDKNFKVNLPLLGGTLIVLLVVLFFPYKSISATAIDGKLQKIIALLLIVYATLIFLMSKKQYKNLAQIGIIVLIIFELSYFSYQSYDGREPITKKEFAINAGGYNDGTIQAVEYIKSIDNSQFYRLEKDYQSGNAIHGSLNDAQAQGYFGTTNYSSFSQLNYIRFLEETEIIQKGDETASRWVRGLRAMPLFQTFGNVKYHLSKNEKPQFMYLGFDSLTVKNGITILKNRYYLPFGYTYDKYINVNDFKQLNTYIVTEQALSLIRQEFQMHVQNQAELKLVDKLTKLINNEFAEKDEFIAEIENLIGKEPANKYKHLILKHSVNTFNEQLLLLNGFVYEEANKFDISSFEQISLTDTNIFISPQRFNFDKYATFVNELKKDTFRLEKFTNSKITGSIELSKKKMLFFTIPYDKGWKIKVNGKKEVLSRVNFGFTGIVLPEGKHEIELYYIPQYSKITTIISIVSIILFWLFLGYYVYRKVKTQKLQ